MLGYHLLAIKRHFADGPMGLIWILYPPFKIEKCHSNVTNAPKEISQA